MVWTSIWDVQDDLAQIWRTRCELTHTTDQILVRFGQPSEIFRGAVELDAYKGVGELPGAARSAATGSEL